jgi:hypothetical protein
LQVGLRLVISPIEGRIYDFLPRAYADQIRNKEYFSGIQIFDLWTCTRDTRQAVYWKRSQQKKFTVTFIDNGHCFGGPNWKLPASITADSLPSVEERSYWLAKLDSLSPCLISHLADEIPPEWYWNDIGGLYGMLAQLVVRRADMRCLLAASRQTERQVTPERIAATRREPFASHVLLEEVQVVRDADLSVTNSQFPLGRLQVEELSASCPTMEAKPTRVQRNKFPIGA